VKKKKMKKMGIILAVLVITTFFVGAVAALPANNPPDQREKFIEISAVQGVGEIYYEKTVLDKDIAVDVVEMMYGDTGANGSFAMTIHEVLNEGVRLNCSGNCTNMGTITDPIYGDADRPVMTNFECKKMVQFEAEAEEYNKPGSTIGLSGTATYNSPGFYTGLNAKVTENYGYAINGYRALASLQKDETVKMTTTATYNGTGRDCDKDWTDCDKYKPYTANELNFDTKNAFEGAWETKSRWKKVCNKDVEHHQRFVGQFQVDKNLIFKEEVTKPCPEKIQHEGGDC